MATGNFSWPAHGAPEKTSPGIVWTRRSALAVRPLRDAEFGGGGSAGTAAAELGVRSAGTAAAAPKGNVVHLRVQQRNGKKTLTTVPGLSADAELCCNGVVVDEDDDELGSVIQLQGDHRKAVAAFLVKASMATKANIKVHGS